MISNTKGPLALVFCCMLTLSSVAQTVSAEEQDLHQTIQRTFDALNTSDIATLEDLLTNDVHFYEYGEAWDIDKIKEISLSKKSKLGYNRIDRFEFVRTKLKGSTAWVTYYLNSDITLEGKTATHSWMETVILQKQNGKWKVDVLHSTRLQKK